MVRRGRTYPPSSVPDLIGTAGLVTSQLQWQSSINGPLGSGGDVAISNRLSPGQHTLTATVLGSTVAQASIQITVSPPPPPPVINVNPAVVLVGALVSTGPFTITYSSGYNSLDWWRSVNGAAFQLGFSTSGSGSFSSSIAANTTYQYKVYQHGTNTPAIGNVTVRGQAAPAPVLTIAPTTVQIPAGATTGPFGYSWNAPGYASLDLWGKVNSGPFQYCCVVASVSNTGDNIPLGSTYQFRFYPHGSSPQGGSVNLVGNTTLSVTGVRAPAPTFSITPSHVIVPANASSGTFTMAWSAPGYNGLDLWGKTNSGPWQFGIWIPEVGNTGNNIPVGTTYSYRFYPHGSSPQGGTQNLIGSLSVYATH